MKYDTVQIRQKVGSKKWEVIFSRDDTDRQRTASKPHAMGFYHYPRPLISDERAFDKLKLEMMGAHRNDITRLERSLKKLIYLKYDCRNKKA